MRPGRDWKSRAAEERVRLVAVQLQRDADPETRSVRAAA